MRRISSARVRPRAAVLLLAAAAMLAALAAWGSGAGASARCAIHGPLPDPLCTPGAIFSGASARQICRAGYSRSVRNVPYGLKRRTYYAYGIRRHPRGSFEIDHLIPLELGGSNAPSNLWPEAAPGFGRKDRLENALHDTVCSGRVDLRAAQREIARNWYAAWLRAGRP